MAVIGRLGNPDIEYGNPTDIRMNNGNTGVVRPPIGMPPPTPTMQYCPEGQTLLGIYDGKPKCSEPRKKYRGDKQLAYEKAIAQGIKWTGQYTKNEVTGEVAPKPIEVLVEEKKNEIVNDINDATSGDDNLLKKYWWVLAAIGVYLVISND
jgi:hypothetical protein